MLLIVFWLSIAIVILAVLNFIPGVKLLVTPVINMLTKLIEAIFSIFVGYLVWFIKLIFFSYFDLFRHLVSKRKKFFPAEKAEE